MSSFSSRENTTPPTPPLNSKQPQLFLDVEDKTEEACSKFEEIPACTYQNKIIGNPSTNTNAKRKLEFMTCDCQEEWDGFSNLACGEDSNCINRITSVECINDSCFCGNDCQNQRFQKQQYSNVSVFKTELKGYGLKAEDDLYENQFIYEYIGEVIDEAKFRQRMIEYDSKKYTHFYFMMLKPDAFIDATEKGSLARFVNHSCNPNAYVDKWVVGDKLKMGIFAKRKILKGEEISFDYNVDRYGAQKQPCYCGEPNCIKFMGGKTQTDAALLLPEGIADALGVTSKEERAWLKENKHLRSKQQKDDATINEQFVKSLQVQPITENDVSKVMSALMKSQETPIIKQLITRMNLTEDPHVNSLIVKFHGYKSLSGVLQSTDDDELIISILETLERWPAVTKNKIAASQIEEVISEINSKTENETIKDLASSLFERWSKLQMAYRIPKNNNAVTMPSFGRISRTPEQDQPQQNQQAQQYSNYKPVAQFTKMPGLPPNWEAAFDANSKQYYYFNTVTNVTTWEKPIPAPMGPRPPSGPGPMGRSNKYNTDDDLAKREERRIQREKEAKHNKLMQQEQRLKELIANAKAPEKPKPKEPERKERRERSHSHSHSHNNSPENLEMKWKHLLAKYVPNMIRKYEPEIGRDNVKHCAKELVNAITSKELRQNKPPPKVLEEHKIKKVKDFTKQYMEKFIVKYRAKKRKPEQAEDATKRVKIE
ncbi:unnamed protein product [Candida verbasci]|uniref:Histone-lysine N-methyltransferase, H3 lysine-36 specific n=1 Tax=Candida verbasci TaxID=1227364 RepID=A0A9W4TXR3_9ASCO|nr:unnamed protein product [Candida verbasci]